MAEDVVLDRFLDAGEEPAEVRTPIAGYETVDLVSLEDAVIPLASLLNNLHAMVQTAKRSARHPENGLTQDESAAIHLYTIQWPRPYPSLYTLLNQILRSQDRDSLVIWYSYLKLLLTALYKLPSIKPCNIWRGIRGNVSDQYVEDQIWWGVSSCTETLGIITKFIGATGVRTLFSIECINGKAIQAHSHYKRENEILLMPGTYFKVIGKSNPSEDLHIIHLRETPPPYEIITLPISTNLRAVQVPSSPVNLTASNNALNNVSDHSQASAPLPPSVSTTTSSTSSKPKRRSIATQLPDHHNITLEQSIINNGTNPQLKLVFMNLTDEDMQLVAYFGLRNNKTLTVLNLSTNNIGDKGLQYLSSELRNNKTLMKLSLYNNQIGSQGIQYLSDILKENSILSSLNLSSNQIGDEGVQHLCDALQNNMTLVELYLTFNQIGEKGANYLSGLLKNGTTLIVLDLSANEIQNKGIEYLADGIQNNQTLSHLNISSNEIDDVGIQYLSDILSNNTTLHILNLQNNQLKCRGMEYLKNALQNNTALTTLDLASNQIGEQGMNYLAELREKNPKLNIST